MQRSKNMTNLKYILVLNSTVNCRWKKRPATIFVGGRTSANAIHFEIRLGCGDKRFTRAALQCLCVFRVRSLLIMTESVVDVMIATASTSIRSDRGVCQFQTLFGWHTSMPIFHKIQSTFNRQQSFPVYARSMSAKTATV